MFVSRSQDFLLSLLDFSRHIAKFVQKPLARVVSHPRTKGAQFANTAVGVGCCYLWVWADVCGASSYPEWACVCCFVLLSVDLIPRI